MFVPIKEPPQALLDSLFEKETKNPLRQGVKEAYEWGMVCFDSTTESVTFDLARVALKIATDSSDIVLEMSTLKTKKPLIFKPTIKFSPYKICIENADLNINPGDIEANTREEAISKLRDQLRVMWNEYAKEPDENLTDDALKLKRNLLDTFREPTGIEEPYPLYGSDLNCDHEITSSSGGGALCRKCNGWFCF
jgi:hypothetical protein